MVVVISTIRSGFVHRWSLAHRVRPPVAIVKCTRSLKPHFGSQRMRSSTHDSTHVPYRSTSSTGALANADVRLSCGMAPHGMAWTVHRDLSLKGASPRSQKTLVTMRRIPIRIARVRSCTIVAKIGRRHAPLRHMAQYDRTRPACVCKRSGQHKRD
jgi:hypothetical protein